MEVGCERLTTRFWAQEAEGDPLSPLPLIQFLLHLPPWTQGTHDVRRGWEKLNVHKCDQRENSGYLGLLGQTAK